MRRIKQANVFVCGSTEERSHLLFKGSGASGGSTTNAAAFFGDVKHSWENGYAFDLVVVENHYEGLNVSGAEIVKQIKEYKPYIKTVLVADEPIKNHYADLLILNPVDIDSMREQVKAMYERELRYDYHILMVCNNVDLSLLLKTVLRKINQTTEVTFVTTSEMARGWLKDEQPDLLICDNRLEDNKPENWGQAIIAEAKELYPGLKSILMSGAPLEEEDHGADIFLTKPFKSVEEPSKPDIQVIEDAIKTLLNPEDEAAKRATA